MVFLKESRADLLNGDLEVRPHLCRAPGNVEIVLEVSQTDYAEPIELSSAHRGDEPQREEGSVCYGGTFRRLQQLQRVRSFRSQV